MEALLTALGVYVPERIVNNRDFLGTVETTEEWILTRTGIRTRHYTAANEFTSDMCVSAARALAENSGKDLSDVDMVLVSTVTPDQPMPSMACLVQNRLGIERAGALDVNAACAGFTYGIVVGNGLIAAGTHKKVLVIGADNLSRVTDFSDRSSCILFGDAAGAVLLEAANRGNIGACVTGSYGAGGSDLYLSGFSPLINDVPIQTSGKLIQNGRKVFKWAVTTVAEQMQVLLNKNKLAIGDIDWFVPHSANLRILEAICHESGFPFARVLESIVDYGNTSSASIPLALHGGIQSGKLQSGHKVMMLGFGGGLAYAGTIIDWP